jgi:hypothetical protein
MASEDPWAIDPTQEDVTGITPALPQAIRRGPFKRLRRREPPKGNTKTGDAPAARNVVIARAQGKERQEPDQWREDLKAGDRGKVISELTSRKITHNAASGFGLANSRWWE